MKEPIDKSIDQLITDDREVKAEALSINSLEPDAIIENAEVTEDITSNNNEQPTENITQPTESSVFTGQEVKLDSIRLIPVFSPKLIISALP